MNMPPPQQILPCPYLLIITINLLITSDRMILLPLFAFFSYAQET